jgi:enoyl-CoA hydratase
MSVRVEREGAITLVTVERPERLNALDTATLRALLAAVQELATEEAIAVVVLTGAGDRAFIAGADISEMVEKSPAEALAFAELGHAVCRAIEEAPQPYIAAVNGYALGGGCEIALACDIRLASERAVFAQPEVTLGIPPGWGGSQTAAARRSSWYRARVALYGAPRRCARSAADRARQCRLPG